MNEKRSPFRPHIQELPKILPLFPLSGALLLPRGDLPLNIFEPRHLAMIDDALATDRMIGMVQPCVPDLDVPVPPIYATGCGGRITTFTETEDGRYLISLTGICRFRIKEEIDTLRGYRRCKPTWTPYRHDLEGDDFLEFDRDELISLLQSYFRNNELEANWDVVEGTSNAELVTQLGMICPFAPTEKQALLEATTISERAAVMKALLEMAVAEPIQSSDHSCH